MSTSKPDGRGSPTYYHCISPSTIQLQQHHNLQEIQRVTHAADKVMWLIPGFTIPSMFLASADEGIHRSSPMNRANGQSPPAGPDMMYRRQDQDFLLAKNPMSHVSKLGSAVLLETPRRLVYKNRRYASAATSLVRTYCLVCALLGNLGHGGRRQSVSRALWLGERNSGYRYACRCVVLFLERSCEKAAADDVPAFLVFCFFN